MDKASFEAEADRLLDAARSQGLVLRLVGAVAFAKRCPGHVHLQDALGRPYTDIDFAAYGKHAQQIRLLLGRLGYVDDAQVFVDSEGSRIVAENPESRIHVDVFVDKLDFCHMIPWKGRLDLDDSTIPLAEMLLQKMQIVHINEKDIIDTIMLLLEHPLGDSDRDEVNIGLVSRVCAKDWGWWRTLTMNLDKVRQMADSYSQLGDGEKRRVSQQVELALRRIEEEPKSLSWKMRARVGDRKKWYRDVGDLVPTHAVEQ